MDSQASAHPLPLDQAAQRRTVDKSFERETLSRTNVFLAEY